MKGELRKWSLADYKELKDLCNAVDRSYLSDRLPNPYTEDDANWWLNMVAKRKALAELSEQWSWMGRLLVVFPLNEKLTYIGWTANWATCC